MSMCPDDILKKLIQQVSISDEAVTEDIELQLAEFSGDPRLHFLLASVLVSRKQFIEANARFAEALDLDPEYHIARFQYGFFLLTSGDIPKAIEILQPLERLPKQHYLSLFSKGLLALSRDDFQATTEALQAGIATNNENLPLNRDMGLIIEKCQAIMVENKSIESESDISETAMFLKQFTKH